MTHPGLVSPLRPRPWAAAAALRAARHSYASRKLIAMVAASLVDCLSCSHSLQYIYLDSMVNPPVLTYYAYQRRTFG
jgi:hypothetical protein